MTDSADLYESTQFEISSIVLITSSGESVDIKMMVNDLNIYEDIFANVLSGDIEMKDAHGLVSSYNIHGNEYLYIKFQTPGLRAFEKFFRIYKISNLGFRNLNSYEYKIHFCSEEFILNQQMRISKSYKGQKTSSIVADILVNRLNVDFNKIYDIEETKVAQNLIIPNMKPLEAINWLASFSINDRLSTAYMFYETHSGFNFRSLESIYDDAVYKTLSVLVKNHNDDLDKRINNHYIVDRFEVKQPFDILEGISSGGFASSMIGFDLTTQQAKGYRFNQVQNSVKKLNEFFPFNEATNRNGLGLVDGSAYMRYFPMFQGSSLVDKWLLQRATQFAMLNSLRMSVQTSGDSQLEAGKIINLDYPFVRPQNESSETTADQKFSGKYLVTAVRHRIFNNKYINYIEICKDSNIGAVPSAPSNNTLYDLAKKS